MLRPQEWERRLRQAIAEERSGPDRLARRETLFEKVYQTLRADILSCRLRPGEKLQINTRAGDREVSLGVVREALTRLAAEGLVVAEPQLGFHVAPVSLADLEDLTNARVEIENLCLTRSIEQGGVEWETAIVAARHRLSRTPYWAPDDDRRLSEEWVAAHSAFHEALVSATNSNWLSRIRSSLYQQSERYRRLSVPVRPAKRDVEEEHQAITEATLGRQKVRACELMKEHLVMTMNIIVEGLPLPPPTKGD
jgi:DNA-binding GntR family transcriptional regulator